MAVAPVSVPRELYPEIEPYATGMLDVGDGHRMYWECSGNPNGYPALFVHGGPGSGTSPKQRRFFDPAVYKIILLDQRGSGKSEPFASLEANTTWHLVADMEKLRAHLGVDKWLVFGGSWGSTLALAYAQTHPERVSHLVLRGIFMLRKAEIDFFYQGPGTNFYFPDAWQDYEEQIPAEERGDMVAAYYKRLTSPDEAVRAAACHAWSTWEGRTATLLHNEGTVSQFSGDKFSQSLARIECHYFVNRGFLESEDQLLKGVDKIRHIPTVIVQGRYDSVCPMKTAWDLHKAWPQAQWVLVPDAGHNAFEPGIQRALLDACDAFRPATA